MKLTEYIGSQSLRYKIIDVTERNVPDTARFLRFRKSTAYTGEKQKV
jgi:hypothetical protein